MKKTITEYADAYRKLGWTVIPLFNNSKAPSSAAKHLPNGGWTELQKRKPTDEEHILWFHTLKPTGIGVVTGKLSNLTVIDEDSYKEKGESLPRKSPLISLTGGGGKHHFFSYKEGTKNKVDRDTGIDLRSEGGFIVLPPSAHPDGGMYKWENEEGALFSNLPAFDEDYVPFSTTGGEKVNLSDYIGVENGSRDNDLLRVANSLFNKYPEEEAIMLIQKINNTYSPPKSHQDVERIINQARKFVANNPKMQKQELEIKNWTPPKPKTLLDIGNERISEREVEKGAPSTGYRELDDLIKGFVPTHLYLLTGDTNVGKTQIASNFMHRVAKQGKKVMYFALEPRNKISEYYHTIRTGKHFSELTDPDLLHDDSNISFYTGDIDTIEQLIKTIECQERQDLIIIDHIGYFIKQTENTTQAQSNAVKKLVDIANRQKTAVMYIVHQKKGTKKGTFDMDMISGSAAFKQDSTEVIMIKRRLISDNPDEVVFNQMGILAVTKTKMGSAGTVNLFFDLKSGIVKTESDIRRGQQ